MTIKHDLDDNATIAEDPSMNFHSIFSCKPVLVTGGEGFIGSHLVEKLVSLGAIVTVLDIAPCDRVTNLSSVLSSIEYRSANMVEFDFESLLQLGKFTHVFHLAGNANVLGSVENPWDDFQSNTLATLRLLEALRKSSRPASLVLASSAAVYGDSSAAHIREDSPVAPISPYGVSKLATDQYAAVYARLYGLRVASLRPFAVYGPRLRKQVVFDMIRKISRAVDNIEARGDGSQVRDFCFVSDVVNAALVIASVAPLQGEVYNVAMDQAYSIRELVQIVAAELKADVEVCWSGSVSPGEPQRWYPDTARLRDLGWNPTVRLHDGIQRTVDWYLKNAADG